MRAELIRRAAPDNAFDRERSRTCRVVLPPMRGACSARCYAALATPSSGGIATAAGSLVRSRRRCARWLD